MAERSKAMRWEELFEICAANGLTVNELQRQRLIQYEELLREKNRQVNLVSRQDADNLAERHMLHCLTLLVHGTLPADCNVLDLGCGGGLPGLVLAIMRPDAQVCLVDSTRKKIEAVQQFIGQLELNNAQAEWGRVEALAAKDAWRNRFVVVVARAVAPLEKLEAWTRPLRTPQSTMLLLKGGDLDQECQQLRAKVHVSLKVTPLQLKGYDEFDRQQKKLVELQF